MTHGACEARSTTVTALAGAHSDRAHAVRFGRGVDTLRNPHRAQISQFELFELMLFLKLDKQLPVERFEARVSQSTVPSPHLRGAGRSPGVALTAFGGNVFMSDSRTHGCDACDVRMPVCSRTPVCQSRVLNVFREHYLGHPDADFLAWYLVCLFNIMATSVQ